MPAFAFAVGCLLGLGQTPAEPESPPTLRLSWRENILSVHGDHLPGGVVRILYMEAYCRAGAHETDWDRTVIGHITELLRRSDDGRRLVLRCTLSDGVTVRHEIAADGDVVRFEVTATNPTQRPSQSWWAQPCIRVGDFTGLGDPDRPESYAYLKKSFVFLDGALRTMPTPRWAKQARYTPGQVWRAPHVPAADVNPRPLNPLVPSNGLIGCFSADDRMILATAWEPWHELFQGVITCLHSDLHIGGLQPGQSKRIRGRLYLVPNDVPALLERHRRELPPAGDSPEPQP